MAKINSLIFDKTGTLTSTLKQKISYSGQALSLEDQQNIKALFKNSNHPLSRMLYDYLDIKSSDIDISFEEIIGKGIQGTVNQKSYKIGSQSFVNNTSKITDETSVHIAIDNNYLGRFIFQNQYRSGISEMFKKLSYNFNLGILSGDNDGEFAKLSNLLPEKTQLIFNQNQKINLTTLIKSKK